MKLYKDIQRLNPSQLIKNVLHHIFKTLHLEPSIMTTPSPLTSCATQTLHKRHQSIKIQSLAAATVCAFVLTVFAFGFAQNAYGQAKKDSSLPITNETVAATVNGEAITIGDLKTLLSLTNDAPPLSAVYPQIIQEVTRRRLISQAAKANGFDKDPGIERRISAIRRGMMIEAYLRSEGRRRLGKDALRQEYDKIVAENPPEDTVRARHILLESEAQAQATITRLKAGEDFASLAKDLSTGPSGKNGGDLGYFRKKEMVPEFANAAFAMDVGTFSASPVKTQFGWHVIYVEDRKRDEPPTYEELLPTLESRLIGEMSQKILADLSKNADIKIKDIDVTAIE